MRTAVLGTGAMGSGMARSLRRRGMDVTVWNRTPARADPLAGEGITVAGSVAQAVAGAGAVVTMLFDATAVLDVAAQIRDGLEAGSVWLQCSTIGPAGMAEVVAATGSEGLVDAPVLGTKGPAESGTLTVLVSGDRVLVDRAGPVLDAVGTRTIHAGERIGEASALKLACNAWIATITAATGQSLALASGLGVDASLFLDAIRDTPADSPYAQVKGAAMARGDYTPSFGVDGLVKDIDLMVAAAAGTGCSTYLLEAVRALYARASEGGHGSDDIAAVRAAFDT
ncbi:MAG: NAD(P)-dependent oxidoreductase [Acidimicrobiales bacterium]